MLYVNSNENEKSFIELYEKFYKKIFNYIYRSVYEKEIAEDLTSSTFLKALDFINKKDPEIKNFSAWIYKIATNELLMHHRYKKIRKNISLDDEESLIKNTIEDKNNNNAEKYTDYLAVKEALKKLKPNEAIVVQMHFFENKDYSEISEILNIKESTLRSKVHRILKKVNEILET